ncbi:MAG: DUF1810 family protein [Bacilli bacterium]|nr:DUF1810 family protein [Bacilli bacterium]
MNKTAYSSNEKKFLDNLTELESKAFDIAFKAHKGQVDKAGADYIHHPIKVAMGCTSEKSRVVAFLHDVVEDTDITLETLSNIFDKDIIVALKLVTKTNNTFYPKYLSDIKDNDLAREVKLSDLSHNMDLSRIPNPGKWDMVRLNKYQRSKDYLLGNTPFYDLERYMHAQDKEFSGFDLAMKEIKQRNKRSHWMWYIFPQIRGLGNSDMDATYSVVDLGEAKAYLDHPVLGVRMVSLTKAVLSLGKINIYDVFHFPDTLKLRSSMTLFHLATGQNESIYKQVIDKYFDGKFDAKTISLLEITK